MTRQDDINSSALTWYSSSYALTRTICFASLPNDTDIRLGLRCSVCFARFLRDTGGGGDNSSSLPPMVIGVSGQVPDLSRSSSCSRFIRNLADCRGQSIYQADGAVALGPRFFPGHGIDAVSEVTELSREGEQLGSDSGGKILIADNGGTAPDAPGLRCPPSETAEMALSGPSGVADDSIGADIGPYSLCGIFGCSLGTDTVCLPCDRCRLVASGSGVADVEHAGTGPCG